VLLNGTANRWFTEPTPYSTDRPGFCGRDLHIQISGETMSEVTDLTVIEIKPEQAPVLYVAGGLDAYLEQIRQAVNEVPDLSTKKGRDRVASLARRCPAARRQSKSRAVST
jgi:hypothetical protein